jgi:hypothetical protein
MYEVEMLMYIVVRMSILFADASMRSPARMCDSESKFFIIINFLRYLISKIRDFPYRSDELKISFIISYKQPR